MGKKATSDPDITLLDDDLDEDDDRGDEVTNTQPEDRGDVVTPEEPPLDAKAIKKLAAEAKDDDAEEDGDKREPGIPKSRFDEVNEALKAVRAQNEALLAALSKGGTAPAATTTEPEAPKAVDLDALEEAYANALLDGDMAKAKGIRKEIREEEKRQAKEEAITEMSAAEERKLFDAQVKAAYAAYPALRTDSKDTDPEAIAEVVKWRDYLVASKNLPLHIALRDAVETVAAVKGWKESEAPGREPKVPPTNRATEQGRKNAEAANAQPPQLSGGVGERAGRARQLDVEKMSDAEFKALPEEEKRRLRGDEG